MSTTATADRTPTFDRGTSLAVERTRLAHERTMMAWVRTATSLISFGFTIYKFFQLEGQKTAAAAVDAALVGPREFATLMIGTGLVALAISSVQHVRETRRMRATYHNVPFSAAGAVAILVSVIGVLALGAVIFKQ